MPKITVQAFVQMQSLRQKTMNNVFNSVIRVLKTHCRTKEVHSMGTKFKWSLLFHYQYVRDSTMAFTACYSDRDLISKIVHVFDYFLEKLDKTSRLFSR